MIVLLACPAADRTSSAVQWRLVEYDPVTLLPIADVGDRWQPADARARPATGTDRPAITPWLTAWVVATLGRPVGIRDAGHVAGSAAWRVESAPADEDRDHEEHP